MKRFAFAGIVALTLFGCSNSEPPKSTAKQSSALETSKAFVVAFGQPAPATLQVSSPEAGVETINFTPDSLIEISPGLLVLISSGANESDCHACSGRLAVHYMTQEKGEYKTLGRWLDVGGAAPYGQSAKWEIRYDIEKNPVIWTTVEDGGQGCLITVHDIISLLPAQATLSARGLPTLISYDGGGGDVPNPAWKTDGKLTPGKDRQSFDMVYSGKFNGTIRFEKYQDEYMPIGNYDGPGLSC